MLRVGPERIKGSYISFVRLFLVLKMQHFLGVSFSLVGTAYAQSFLHVLALNLAECETCLFTRFFRGFCDRVSHHHRRCLRLDGAFGLFHCAFPYLLAFC